MNFNVIANIMILVMMFFYEFIEMLDSHPNISFINLPIAKAIKLLTIITLSAIYKSIPLLLAINIMCSPTAHNA